MNRSCHSPRPGKFREVTVSSYLTVRHDGTGEIDVEKSRFLCTIARVTDEVDARGVVDQVRKQHWNARHHCSAFIVGPGRAVEQSSDDGEPPGTAGRPSSACSGVESSPTWSLW